LKPFETFWNNFCSPGISIKGIFDKIPDLSSAIRPRLQTLTHRTPHGQTASSHPSNLLSVSSRPSVTARAAVSNTGASCSYGTGSVGGKQHRRLGHFDPWTLQTIRNFLIGRCVMTRRAHELTGRQCCSVGNTSTTARSTPSSSILARSSSVSRESMFSLSGFVLIRSRNCGRVACMRGQEWQGGVSFSLRRRACTPANLRLSAGVDLVRGTSVAARLRTSPLLVPVAFHILSYCSSSL
jgi:hypothetical protein